MVSQQHLDFERIAQAIAFIQNHFQAQPTLEEIAAAVHLSPYHFQRLFSEWAGVSPKKFVQYLSINYAKSRLREQQSLLDTAYETGLSGTSRLHDLFVHIEGMTPGAYKNGGAPLTLRYQFAETLFGSVLVASTPKGVCHLQFISDQNTALQELKHHFPQAHYICQSDAHQQQALGIFQADWQNLKQVKLHLAGTPFQLKVWECLLKIPQGGVQSYGGLAQALGQPKAARAVGSAIGKNPVAFLIPCHRVIQNTGQFGGYRWGSVRKAAMLSWEACQQEQHDHVSY